MEDAKAARSVRVWDRVPMKKIWVRGIDIGASEKENEFSFSLSFHYISRLAAANIGCASEK